MGTLAFSKYVARTYGETYGALGGVVLVLLCLYSSGFAILLGSESDATHAREASNEIPAEPRNTARRWGEAPGTDSCR